MSYTYDIFLNYNVSHEPNEVELKWCSNMAYFLNVLLSRLLNRKPVIITSEDLYSKEELFKHSFEDILSKTALFIVIYTKNCKNSKQWNSEFEIISKQIGGAGILNEEMRVFKILKEPVPQIDQPDVLKKILNFDFYVPQAKLDDLENIENIDTYFVEEVERHFWIKLVDLSYELFHQLDVVSQKKESFYFGKTIYLAEVTPDQVANRDSIKRELQRHGFKILPDRNLPEEPLSLRAEVYDYLGRSCLSVHIIGEEYGELLNNSDFSSIDLQNRLAADYFDKVKDIKIRRGGYFFSRVIWISPDLKLNNEEQLHFIEQLKRDSEALRGADILETPIEVLKTVIKKKANENALVRPTKEEMQQRKIDEKKKKTKPIVYLIYEKAFEEEIELIYKWFQNNGFDLFVPDYTKNVIDIMKLHREYLSTCDGVIIYFNGTNSEWLKTKIHDLVKAPGYGRDEPMRSKAIYENGLNIVDEEIFEKHNVMKIADSGSLAQKFHVFAEQLKKIDG